MDEPMFQKLHAIQLEAVKVIELFIRSNRSPDLTVGAKIEEFSLSSEHSAYDPKSKTIRVWSTVEIGMGEKPETPFSMKIRIIGFFRVDDEKFNIEHIDHWAKKNAPIILYPFIREHAFALSARCGFEPIMLPLLQLPTLIPKRKPATKKKNADT